MEKLYNLRRCSGTMAGSVVIETGSLRACLSYLKRIAEINAYRMERDGFTFIGHKTRPGVESKMYRIETLSEGKFNEYLRRTRQ